MCWYAENMRVYNITLLVSFMSGFSAGGDVSACVCRRRHRRRQQPVRRRRRISFLITPKNHALAPGSDAGVLLWRALSLSARSFSASLFGLGRAMTGTVGRIPPHAPAFNLCEQSAAAEAAAAAAPARAGKTLICASAPPFRC